jgi:hypothetical protein
MVAVVNGYVCFTTCDADKAKQGEDPLAPPGTSADEDGKKKNGLNGRPATILDGALKNLKDAVDPAKESDRGNPASGQAPPDTSRSSSSVDLYA